jgi:phosphonate transport system substrate-binding protein
MKRLISIAVAAIIATAGTSQAQFALDSRYTDADGDLIADIPTDPSKLVDPDTLIFAYTPVEDPAVYAVAWSDFLTYMEKVTGKKVQFFPVQSNAAQIEAMRAGSRWPAPASGRSPSWPKRTARSATRWRL